MLPFLLFLLFLAGCSHSDSWHYAHLKTADSQYDAKKLAFLNPDKVNGIDMEILLVQETLHIYLNVHSTPILSHYRDAKQALVTIRTGEERMQLLAFRHEGGKRILLPETIYPTLLSTLRAGTPILIELEGYRATVEGKGFEEKFHKLQKGSSFSIPLKFLWYKN